jgi:hypothetical protein
MSSFLCRIYSKVITYCSPAVEKWQSIDSCVELFAYRRIKVVVVCSERLIDVIVLN